MHLARRTATLSAAAVAILTALGGCGADDGQAAADGSIVLYSGRDEELVGPIIDAFVDESGIEVEVRPGDTTELAAQLLEEGDSTQADVFLSQDAGALGALAEDGAFAPLPQDVAGAVPAAFTSTDGTWVGVTGRARVFAYDPRDVEEAALPETVQGFTDPRWSGQVAVAPTNASFQAFVTALRVTEGEDVAEDFLEGLVDNDVQVYESNGDILAAIEAGQVDVGLINHYYLYELAAEVGAENVTTELKFAEPGTAGALVNVSGAGIMAGAEGDEDAEELVRYLVSEAAQTAFAEQTFEYPLVEGVPGPEGLPELSELVGGDFDLARLESLEETTALIQSVGLV
ncbi:MAG: iron ABC transporter substrate-binding protein [Actinomycetota bacterium]|nr:iron ABC transporter substrate-binding protein [Actinomycetota bacterium]